MKRFTLFLFSVLVLSALVYAGGKKISGRAEMTNVIDTTGNSSAVSDIIDGDWMLDRTSLVGHIVVKPSVTTSRGYGLADTCTIVIKTTKLDGISVDSTWKAGLPCTSFVAIPANDTLFGDNFYIYIRIADSSADSNFTAKHLIEYNLIAR